ncbi:phosphoribosyltransferase [Azospirillum sp. SYSU D00513]|uniref:phosphoribosyltransferase n=1 Tax=Azospirillum sp. SYSU D00513 TaxID=2812561 RepID=UPI001A9693EC|nr:phosphoribosyltransferase [Azospirillum sp. SYSU D00513]
MFHHSSQFKTFHDRREAGRLLARRLLSYRDASPVVLALPRGGVPVAYEIALALSASLDLVMVRKIGAPGNPEFGIGAVVDGHAPITVMDEELVRHTGASDDYITQTTQLELAEIERRRTLYLKGRSPVDVKGRTLIVVDDGVATGSTMRVALHALRRAGPERLVMAVPVVPADTLEAIKVDCDAAVCVLVAENFPAVGFFYRNFAQLEDREVIDLLSRVPDRNARGPKA